MLGGSWSFGVWKDAEQQSPGAQFLLWMHAQAGLAVAGKLWLCWAHGSPGFLAKDASWALSSVAAEVNYFNSKQESTFLRKFKPQGGTQEGE